MGRFCYASTVKNFLMEEKTEWLDKMKSQFTINSVLPLGSSQVHA